MIGGRLFRHSIVNVGAGAVEEIKRIRADIYFMGVTGIHPDAGLSTGDLEEANIKLDTVNAKTWFICRDPSSAADAAALNARLRNLAASHTKSDTGQRQRYMKIRILLGVMRGLLELAPNLAPSFKTAFFML